MEYEREMLDVTSMTEENPDFSFTCGCGNSVNWNNQPKYRLHHLEYFDGDEIEIDKPYCPKCNQFLPIEAELKMTRASTTRTYIPIIYTP